MSGYKTLQDNSEGGNDMNNNRKLLILLLCTVTLVATGIFSTLAYLTDKEAVTNTFTIGQVGISLDEAKVNPDGSLVQGADPVQENKYHLLPGHTYTKNPTVHIDSKSESCWVFVKVENGIAAIEDQTNPIAAQIASNGWKVLDVEKEPGVYYQSWEKGADRDLPVFQSFTIDGNKTVNGATTPAGKENIANYANAKVVVTAYAIQMAGFENDQAAAWNAFKTQNP